MIKCGWVKVLTVPARDVTYLVQLFLSRRPGENHGGGGVVKYTAEAVSRKLLEDPKAASGARGKIFDSLFIQKVSHGFRW